MGLVLLSHVLTAYRGPIPSAEEFSAYGRTLPSAPDRLLRMAEEAQQHLQRAHLLELEGEIGDRRAERTERRIGQILGFLLAMTALVTGGIVGGWFGALIGGTGIAGLASAYLQVYRDRARRSEASSRPSPTDSP